MNGALKSTSDGFVRFPWREGGAGTHGLPARSQRSQPLLVLEGVHRTCGMKRGRQVQVRRAHFKSAGSRRQVEGGWVASAPSRFCIASMLDVLAPLGQRLGLLRPRVKVGLTPWLRRIKRGRALIKSRLRTARAVNRGQEPDEACASRDCKQRVAPWRTRARSGFPARLRRLLTTQHPTGSA